MLTLNGTFNFFASPPPALSSPSPPPAPPGGYHSEVVEATFTVAGDVSSFNSTAFRSSMISTFAAVRDARIVSVTPASMRVNVLLYLHSEYTAADVDIAAFTRATPQSNESATLTQRLGIPVESVVVHSISSTIQLAPSPPPPSPPVGGAPRDLLTSSANTADTDSDTGAEMMIVAIGLAVVGGICVLMLCVWLVCFRSKRHDIVGPSSRSGTHPQLQRGAKQKNKGTRDLFADSSLAGVPVSTISAPTADGDKSDADPQCSPSVLHLTEAPAAPRYTHTYAVPPESMASPLPLPPYATAYPPVAALAPFVPPTQPAPPVPSAPPMTLPLHNPQSTFTRFETSRPPLNGRDGRDWASQNAPRQHPPPGLAPPVQLPNYDTTYPPLSSRVPNGLAPPVSPPPTFVRGQLPPLERIPYMVPGQLPPVDRMPQVAPMRGELRQQRRWLPPAATATSASGVFASAFDEPVPLVMPVPDETLRAEFARADRDGDGKLTPGGFRQLRTSMGDYKGHAQPRPEDPTRS